MVVVYIFMHISYCSVEYASCCWLSFLYHMCILCYKISHVLLCRQSVDTTEKNALSPSKPPQRKRKERSPTSVDGVQEQSSPGHLPTEDTNKGEFDIPIAERLKLRREKRKIVPPVAEKKGKYDGMKGGSSTKSSINTRKRKCTELDSGPNNTGKGNDMVGNANQIRSTPKQNGEIPPGVNQVTSGKWVSCVLYILYYVSFRLKQFLLILNYSFITYCT